MKDFFFLKVWARKVGSHYTWEHKTALLSRARQLVRCLLIPLFYLNNLANIYKGVYIYVCVCVCVYTLVIENIPWTISDSIFTLTIA